MHSNPHKFEFLKHEACKSHLLSVLKITNRKMWTRWCIWLVFVWGNGSILRLFDYIRTTAFTVIWPSKVAHNHCWGLLGPEVICLLSSPKPKSGFPFILQKKLVLSAITSTNLIKQNRPLSFWGVYSILHISKYLTIFLKEYSTQIFQCFESKPNRPFIHNNQNKIKGTSFEFLRHLTFLCFY